MSNKKVVFARFIHSRTGMPEYYAGPSLGAIRESMKIMCPRKELRTLTEVSEEVVARLQLLYFEAAKKAVLEKNETFLIGSKRIGD